MNRIATIQLNNFKFFNDQQPALNIGGKHSLIYGENGSGKSTLYWSLYTLFEASLKSTDNDIQKYFRKGPADYDSLVNIHAVETTPGSGDYNSFVRLVTDDVVPVTYEISLNNVAIRTNPTAQEITFASDFINYKLLFKLQDFRHSQTIDLGILFLTDVIKYLQFPSATIDRNINGTPTTLNITNAYEMWKEVEKGPEKVPNKNGKMIYAQRHTQQFGQFNTLVNRFNTGLQGLITYINTNGPQILRTQLGYNFDFRLNLTAASFDKKDIHFRAIPFKITLEVFNFNGIAATISRPHSFLNEARLTAISLSIRLCILNQRLPYAGLKFIVLDDMLISLDMHNREKVLDILLAAPYVTDYQLFILTHDKNFFEYVGDRIKRSGTIANWNFIEMYEDEDPISHNNYPFIIETKNPLQKARGFLKNKEYAAAANSLRQAIEKFCKRYLTPHEQINSTYKPHDLNGLLRTSIHKARTAPAGTIPPAVTVHLNQLDHYRRFVLNKGSHYQVDSPLFRTEIENACTSLEQLITATGIVI